MNRKKIGAKRPFSRRKLKSNRLGLEKLSRSPSEGPQSQAKASRRRVVVQPNSQKIIATLPLLDFEQLRGVWKNCLVKLTSHKDGAWHDSATEVLSAIEIEWDRRSSMAPPDQFFEWPSTEAIGGNGMLNLEPSLSDGMLSYLGYRVGKLDGEVASIRQSILSRVFEGRLPPVFARAYMLLWGSPKSAARLRKIAESMAAFTRNAKRRRDHKMNDAISDWESDLRFLYDRYYVGQFSFAWPLTRV
jgi:hypothetical protein